MITGASKLLGVMGWPVKHSLSPRLHNYWLQQAGIDAVYLPLAVPPAGLAAAVQAMPQMGFVGANVTIPHKEQLIALVDRVDPVAAAIGAINTLVFGAEGSFGTNTDAYGFAENVRQAGHELAAGPALVLGAGGAARAVLAALQQAGCPQILLTNRSPERAQALAQAFGGAIELLDWTRWADALPRTKLLINTTACGLNGQDDFTVALNALPRGAAVNDLVYRPLQTGLLRAGVAADRLAIDGLGMLLYQAQASFRHWFGVTPPVDAALRTYILDGMAA